MDEFISRQPVFDRRLRVYAYELLPRRPSSIIHGAVHVFGFDRLTSGRKALVRLTPTELTEEIYEVLPRERTILEVAPGIDAPSCRKLKQAGYQLVVADPWPAELRNVADIVKVETLDRCPLDPRSARVLVHGVTAPDACRRAIDAGCAYIEGSFYRQPEVLAARDVAPTRLAYLRMLQELHRSEVDFDRLAAIVHQDVALSVKLLRYLNSVALGLRRPVSSVKQALLLLGEQGARRWLSVLAVAGIGEEKPSEVVASSLLRGRFCELLAPLAGFEHREYDCFLTGMLSLLDVLLDRPMSELLESLFVSDAIHAALLGGASRLAKVLALVTAYERGEWAAVTERAAFIAIPEEKIPPIHRRGVEWVEEVYQLQAAGRAPR